MMEHLFDLKGFFTNVARELIKDASNQNILNLFLSPLDNSKMIIDKILPLINSLEQVVDEQLAFSMKTPALVVNVPPLCLFKESLAGAKLTCHIMSESLNRWQQFLFSLQESKTGDNETKAKLCSAFEQEFYRIIQAPCLKKLLLISAECPALEVPMSQMFLNWYAIVKDKKEWKLLSTNMPGVNIYTVFPDVLISRMAYIYGSIATQVRLLSEIIWSGFLSIFKLSEVFNICPLGTAICHKNSFTNLLQQSSKIDCYFLCVMYACPSVLSQIANYSSGYLSFWNYVMQNNQDFINIGASLVCDYELVFERINTPALVFT